MAQQQKQKKSEGTKKKQRPHHFSEPKIRKAKVIARRLRCPHCGAQVRTNKNKRIAWHRTKHMGKWCSRSATKYMVA